MMTICGGRNSHFGSVLLIVLNDGFVSLVHSFAWCTLAHVVQGSSVIICFMSPAAECHQVQSPWPEAHSLAIASVCLFEQFQG